MKRFLIVLAIIFVVVETLILAFVGYFYRSIPVDTYYNHSAYNKVFDRLLDEYEAPTPSRTNEEYRELITSDLNFGFYIYTENELNSNIDGMCIVPLRIITIKSGITGYRYCITFAHEVIHFKKFAKQENYNIEKDPQCMILFDIKFKNALE